MMTVAAVEGWSDGESGPLAPAVTPLRSAPPFLSLPSLSYRLDLALVLDGQFIDDGRDHAARAAPGRPEVDEDGDVGLEDGVFPGRVRDGAG